MTQIALALDQSSLSHSTLDMLVAVRPLIGLLKVGLEGMTAFQDGVPVAHRAARHFSGPGKCGKVLWDIKLHDIPNTIAAAARNLCGEFSGFTMHASAGPKGLAAASAARFEKLGPRQGIEPDDVRMWTTIFGVTVLTSHDETECVHIFGDKPGAKVIQFAKDCYEQGIDGLVISGQELELLQDKGLADKFITLVPGGRPDWAAANDQKRVITPAQIARLKADYAVFGRPISNGPYPAMKAVSLINEEMAAA
jgi:orotidine-5'-phosphate decarboxylase